MRFTVQPWFPEYGEAADPDQEQSDARIAADVERPAADWAPVRPVGEFRPEQVVFVDGVQRPEAIIDIEVAPGERRRGLCASYGAGLVRCAGRATFEHDTIARALLCSRPPEAIVTKSGAVYEPSATAGDSWDDLRAGLQQRMRDLEADVSRLAGPADLVVCDGPLTGRQSIPSAIGYVKTHKVQYLEEDLRRVVDALAAGERTPLFVMRTSWERYSWYARLPGVGEEGWAGIVRCEVSSSHSWQDAARIADAATVVLPRFASKPHKDRRAPQNLIPIAALERHLKHRMGDRELLLRHLRGAGASTPVSA